MYKVLCVGFALALINWCLLQNMHCMVVVVVVCGGDVGMWGCLFCVGGGVYMSGGCGL